MDMRTLREVAAIADPLERARALQRLMNESTGLSVEAARYRRDAIAEARAEGLTPPQIAAALGVSPGRVRQIPPERAGEREPAAKAPAASAVPAPGVLVQRALPTDPDVRGSVSLFLVEAERQGITAERRMLYIGLEPASEHIAACLRVQPGEDVVARRKLMTANGIPVRIATSFFRADLFGDTRMAEPEFVRPSLQVALADLGYNFGRAEENLTARAPTAFERETLELDPGEWVVQIVRASYSTEDTPVHCLETICSAARHVFPIGQVAGADEF
jgi:DNA-binding GntR family transcriptional regulator